MGLKEDVGGPVCSSLGLGAERYILATEGLDLRGRGKKCHSEGACQAPKDPSSFKRSRSTCEPRPGPSGEFHVHSDESLVVVVSGLNALRGRRGRCHDLPAEPVRVAAALSVSIATCQSRKSSFVMIEFRFLAACSRKYSLRFS